MKRNIKVMSLLVSMLICAVIFLTGCGKLEKADVTAQALYDLYILGDSTKIVDIGLSDSDAEKVLGKEEDALKTQIRTNFITAGITLDEAKLDEIVKAQLEAHKKLSGKTELISEDKDTAQVKVTTNYIDIEKIDSDAGNDAAEEVKSMGLTSLMEIREKLVEVYTRNLMDYLDKAEPSSDTVDKTFTFTKQKFSVNGKTKELWMPEDMEAFGENLGRMITNN